MKREVAAIAAITAAVCLLASCGVDTPEVSLPPANPTAQVSPEPSDAGNEVTETPYEETGRILDECLALIGMSDEESASMLGGGEQSFAADGKTLIGRVYSAEIFGESVKPGTSYDEEGRVNGVSIYLGEPDDTKYAEALTALYGEPDEVNGGDNEGGNEWMDWYVDGVQLRLYQGYGLCSISINAVPQNRG